MYIHEYMKSPVFTVTPDTPLDEALRIVRQHHIRRLPVVDNGKLVGLVTRQTLRQASLSSSVIPLSTLGMRYQLLKMKVRDLMITDVVTITPDSTLEEAASLAEQHHIGTLPVVDEKGNLVGMITNTDLNNLITQLLGFGQTGPRLHIKGLGGTEDIRRYQIVEILSKHQAGILSAFSVTPPTTQQGDFIIRLDTEKVEAIVEDMKRLGLEVEVREH